MEQVATWITASSFVGVGGSMGKWVWVFLAHALETGRKAAMG